MQQFFRLFALTLISAFTFVGLATGQVAPGAPNFIPRDCHEVDCVDLLNNNITLNIPIRTKAGAIGFSYALTSNYYAVNVKGTWQVPSQFTSAANGVVGLSTAGIGAGPTASVSVPCSSGTETTTKYYNWTVTSPDGTSHPLPTTVYTDEENDGGLYGASCLTGSGFTNLQTIDGSGFTVSAGPNAIFADSVFARDGSTVGLSGLTDSNGNTISTSGTYPGSIIDSMGLDAIDITDTSLGPFTWKDVSGGTQQVSVTTASHTLQSNFGCTTPADFGPLTFVTQATGISFPDLTSMGLTYETTPGHTAKNTGRIKQITLREGGTISYAYGGGTNNGIDCTYQTVPVLTRTLGNGDQTSYTLTHNLVSGTNYNAVNTVLNPGNNKTIYTFTGFTSTGNATLPTAQVLTQVARYQGSSTLLTTDTYCYNTNLTSCSTAVVSYPITEVDIYHNIQGVSGSTRTQTKYDSYGNVIFTEQFGFGGTPTRSTTITYGSWNGSTCGYIYFTINNKPCDVLTKQNGSAIAETHFTYDSKGNLIATSVWTGSAWIGQTTNNSYNANGTPSTTYDVGNSPTTYAYLSASYSDCGTGGCASLNLPFPTSVTKGGLTTSATWDAMGGVQLTAKDSNGNITTNSYDQNCGTTADPYWRVGSIADPLGNVVCKFYPTGSAPDTSGSTFSFNSGSSVQNTTVTTDAYGRKVNVQKQQGPIATQYDTVSTAYSWSGNYQNVAASQPCSAMLGGTCSTVHASQFDPLGRLHQSTTTGNETLQHTYTQNDDLTVLGPAPVSDGENSKQVQNQYDGLGRLQYSCAIGNGYTAACGQSTGSAVGVTTSYAYGQGAGYSTVAATRDSQTRSKTYDSLGRVTSQTTPESGTTTYIYDSVSGSFCGGAPSSSPGNLMQINNANGANTCYVYDALRRVTDVGGVTTCKRYRYDSVSNGYRTQPSGSSIVNVAGRLVEAETDNCGGSPTMLTDEWFSYDKDGRLTDVWETTPYLVANSLGYYHTSASYFGNGALNTLAGIPGFTTETYGLEGEGRLSTAAEGTNTMMRGVIYNAAGQPTNVNLGSSNGTDNDAYTYDSNTGRMKTWTFTVGSTVGSNTQAGTLNWNPIGTLGSMAVVDNLNSTGTQTCNFGTSGHMGYDDWNRLVYDDCGAGGWGQQFSYDEYDNLTKSMISGRTGSTFNPGYNPSNNQFASGFGASYDASGNLTYDTTHHYAWDAYEKVQSVDATGTNCSTGGECFVYDAQGRVVENDSNGSATEILYSPVGKTAVMSGMTVTYAYIPMPGGSMLFKPNDTTRRYQHKDWLNSTRLISTLSSAVQGGNAFSPYGEVESTNSYGPITNEPNFTGDTQDLVPGLFDTPNRELSSVGRWISPDPAGAGWNLYAYATNPNSQADPTGLFCVGQGCIGENDCSDTNSCFPPPGCTDAANPCGPGTTNYGSSNGCLVNCVGSTGGTVGANSGTSGVSLQNLYLAAASQALNALVSSNLSGIQFEWDPEDDEIEEQEEPENSGLTPIDQTNAMPQGAFLGSDSNGPLSPKDAKNFNWYIQLQLQDAATYYRIWGTPAGLQGAGSGTYYSFFNPFDFSPELDAFRDQMSVPSTWNSFQNVNSVTIPAGTTVFIGPAAPQPGYNGNGFQVFVPNHI